MHHIYFELFRLYIDWIPNHAIGAYIGKAKQQRRSVIPIYGLTEITYHSSILAKIDNHDEEEGRCVELDSMDAGLYSGLYLKAQDTLYLNFKSSGEHIQYYIDKNAQIFIEKRLNWTCIYSLEENEQPRYICTAYRNLAALAPKVYLGSAYYRDEHLYQFMNFVGRNLYQYLNNPQHPISCQEFDNILDAIFIKLAQLHEKNIVHTDLKLENICLEVAHGAYLVEIIDLNDAYCSTNPNTEPDELCGTLTNYPPEFFKPEQLDIPHDQPIALFQFLAKKYMQICTTDYGLSEFMAQYMKQDWLTYFSPASDVYTLGINLLPYLLQYTESRHQHIIHLMTKELPQARPSAEQLCHRSQKVTF